MRLVLLEPRLRNEFFHHAQYALGVARAAQQADLPLRIVCDREIEADLAGRLAATGAEVVPIFETGFLPWGNGLGRWSRVAIDFRRVLKRLFREARCDDIFFTLSGYTPQAAGAIAAYLGPRPHPPLVLQFFVWEEPGWPFEAHATHTPLQLLTQRLLRTPGVAPALLVAGQTQPIADHIAAETGRAVGSLPYLVDVADFPSAPPSGAEPTVGFLGVCRRDKGVDQFARALELAREKAQWLIQMYFTAEVFRQEVTEILAGLPTSTPVETIEGALGIDAYRETLQRLDIVVLPYTPASARHRPSNVAAEAVALGKILVTPQVNWAGGLVEQGAAGVTYSEYSPRGLAGALDEAIRRLDELRAQARAFATRYRADNSPAALVRAVCQMGENHWASG